MKPDDTQYEIYRGVMSGCCFLGDIWGAGTATSSGYLGWINGSAKGDGVISALDEDCYLGSACGAGFVEGGVMAYER